MEGGAARAGAAIDQESGAVKAAVATTPAANSFFVRRFMTETLTRMPRKGKETVPVDPMNVCRAGGLPEQCS
ncbi:hypothetical protein TTY48_35690 [Tsukamurella sp. TY48]|nr:hypothetical protein TTY48_35690 [Tsukamurella sp. TY48]